MITKETLHDNTDITANSKQLEILKRHFPNCFDKNGAFIPHKMAEIVGENGLDLSRESYSLNWLGRSYARLLANLNPQTLLKEDKTHNAKEENCHSQNLLIKGDNLEVLKHLKNAYGKEGGQVKMIYIDPPYNTGDDGFVYNDDRKFTPEQLSRLAGIEFDEAQRILEFTASKSNSHSAWLTFMYPRLYIARELLKDNGVIFISIDDNEAAQLKLLCDEIFGEENFISNFIWKKKGTTSNTKGVEASSLVDSTLSYKKSSQQAIKQRITPKETRTYPYQDELGNYRTTGIEKKDSGAYKRDTMKFPIIGYPPRMGKRWQIGIDEATRLEGMNRFFHDGTMIKLKIYDFEDTDTSSAQPNLLLSHGSTESASKLVNEELLGHPETFDNPKPIELLSHLISISTNPNDLILDFFAGSGTTAHAVMELNKDGGNRKYITIQIAEPTDPKKEAYKAGYRTIFDITKTRIEKAAKKIKSENPEYSGDLGFRVFETIPLFQGADEEIEEFDGKLELYDGSKLNDEELGYLLLTWKTYDGIELTEDLKPIVFANYTGYAYDKTVYFMHKGFSSESLAAFIQMLDEEPTFKPSKLVVYGYNFQSKHQREIIEGLKNYKNKKSIELDVVMRY